MQRFAADPIDAAGCGLGNRWFDLRNRLLASAAFQRHSAAWWPTRWIARRRASRVFDLAAGFVYSQVLLAVMRLRLPALLARGPRPLDAIARHCGLAEDAAERLLAAAAALDLMERRGALWGLGVLGAPLVGNDGLEALVEHHGALYADLADPVALLRNTGTAARLAAYWPYASSDSPRSLATTDVEAYSRLMSASQPLVADEILDAYPFHRHARVLDVGGGDGAFLARLRARCPALCLSLFDLPGVAAIAREKLPADVDVVSGDFHADPLPRGADLITLVRVVHDHDDPRASRLLERAAQALPAGGTLVLAEPMAGTPGAQPMGDAYFGMYLLAMGSGRPRPEARLRSMLLAAGFTQVTAHSTRQPMLVRVLSARRSPV